jgi:glutathione S-transferase
MVIAPQAFGEKPYQVEEVRAALDEFFTQILPMLDKKLQRYEYICGEEVTVADIQLYNEIQTVLLLHKQRRIESRELPNIFAWFNKM